MSASELLTGWGIEHHAGHGAEEGFARFVCPRQGCGGAAKVADGPDDTGQWWLYCKCTADSATGGRPFTQDELARWFGVNGHSRAAGEEVPLAPVVPFERSDAGNAEALAFVHGWQLRYVHQAATWRLWTGRRWADDRTGQAEQLALDVARVRGHWAADLPNRKEAEREFKWAVGSQSAKRIRDCLALAATLPELATTPEQYDTDADLLNTVSGAVDLRTGLLRSHGAADLCSKLARVEYDTSAGCPHWEAFLEGVFDGDLEVVAFVQRAVGYSLTGRTSEQCLFLLWGRGCNGKSTLLGVLKRLLGDYARNADFASFSYQRERQAGVRDDVAALAGARLVTASEPSQGVRLSEGLLKQLTGSDPVTARPLYGRYFDFAPAFKLWLSANHRPTVRDTSEGFWRRVHLVPFTVSFRGREDRRLPEKLAAELPGILNWALTGCLEWQRGGLRPPAAVRAATAEYRAAEDLIGAFLDDRTMEDPGAVTLTGDLRRAYEAWCEEERGGERPAGQNAFADALEERGFSRSRVSGGRRAWQGVRLV